MSFYQYLNAHLDNTNSYPVDIVMEESREPSLITLNEGFRFATEKFLIKKAVLPIYSTKNKNLVITVENRSTGVNDSQQLDFSALEDNEGFLYSFEAYVVALNNAIETACTALSIATADIPEFGLSNRIVNLGMTTNFSNTYKIVVNFPLYVDLKTFPYLQPIQPTDTEFELDIEGETEIKMNEALEVSPIHSILMLADSLPIVREFANSLIGSNTVTIPIITDYTFRDPQDGTMLKDLSFISTNYRWHSCLNFEKLKSVTFRFSLLLNDGRNIPLKIAPNGSCDVKVLFSKPVTTVTVANEE